MQNYYCNEHNILFFYLVLKEIQRVAYLSRHHQNYLEECNNLYDVSLIHT